MTTIKKHLNLILDILAILTFLAVLLAIFNPEAAGMVAGYWFMEFMRGVLEADPCEILRTSTSLVSAYVNRAGTWAI